MKVCIYFGADRDLYAALTEAARRAGTTRSAVAREAVRKYLKKPEPSEELGYRLAGERIRNVAVFIEDEEHERLRELAHEYSTPERPVSVSSLIRMAVWRHLARTDPRRRKG